MRGLLCVCLLACGGTPPPREATPPVARAVPTKPHRERIEIEPLTVHARIPHGPSVVYIPGATPYDGPALTAKLSTNRAVAATAASLARERLAAIEEGRRVYATAMRERAAVDRNAPDAAARLQKIADTRDQKIARVDARRERAASKLRALLDKHAAVLTIEGDVLRAELYLALADDELEKKLIEQEKAGTLENIEPDVTRARQVIDEAFSKHRNAEQSLDARLSRASIYFVADRRTGALLLLQVARDFPTSRFVESAYHQAGHALFGDADALAQANAMEAFRWLADRAAAEENRALARFRLGQLHDRAREWPQAIDQFCKVIDNAVASDALSYVGRAIARGGAQPLRPACAAQTCPCKEQVLVDASLHFREVEDDAPLREVVELGRTYFAQSQSASQWSCDLVEIAFRRGDDAATRTELARHQREFSSSPCVLSVDAEVDDAELVRRHFEGSRAVTTCVEQAIEERRMRGNEQLRVEVSVDERGKAETIVVQSPDPDTSDCIRAWIGRHRWHDLAKTLLVVPLVVEL